MRKIKFRGKRIDNNEWVYGNLIQIRNKFFCPSDKSDINSNMFIEKISEDLDIKTFLDGSKIMIYATVFKVDPQTVGQYIGSKKDVNNKDIYEGDIVKYAQMDGSNHIGIIKYNKESFHIFRDGVIDCSPSGACRIEVVGDRHTGDSFIKLLSSRV